MSELEDHHDQLIYTVDGNGRVFSMAPHSLRLLGFSLEELVGKRAADTLRRGEDTAQVDPVTACAFLKTRQEPGKPRTFNSYVYARDGRCFNLLLTVAWNALSEVWMCRGLITSITPAQKHISNVSKIVRWVEVHPEYVPGRYASPLALPEPVVSEDRPKFKQLALDLLKQQQAEIAQIRAVVEQIVTQNVQSIDQLHAAEHRKRGPYQKDYGAGMKDLLIDDGNASYAKWKALKPPRLSLLKYLSQQFGLPEYTVRRRLKEHGLRLKDLPWTANQVAGVIAAGLGSVLMLDRMMDDHVIHWCEVLSRDLLPAVHHLRF